MKKILTALMILAFMISIFSGCGGSSPFLERNSTKMMTQAAPLAPPVASSSAPAAAAGFSNEAMDMAELELAEYEDSGESGMVAGPQANPVVDSRKIIKNAYMELQTLMFDNAVGSIEHITESFGGFIQNSYVQGRDMYNERGTRVATFTVRVPSEKLDAFINSFGGDEFNLISKSQNSEDITESYFDSKARLDALKVQERRLISMLERAEELEYLLQVEKELMNVRYEIESLTSSLNRLDSYVSLSTVNITLNEVIKYEPVENVPVTFSERISRAFASSWIAFSEFSQDFTVGVISILPFLLMLAVIALIVVVIVRKTSKAGKKPRDQKRQPNADMQQQDHAAATSGAPEEQEKK